MFVFNVGRGRGKGGRTEQPKSDELLVPEPKLTL